MLFPAILAGNVPYNVLWLMSEHIQPASTWSCQDMLPRLRWVLKCGKGRPGKQEPEALCLFPIPEAAAFPAGWPQPFQGELGSCTPSPGASSQGSCPVQTAQSKLPSPKPFLASQGKVLPPRLGTALPAGLCSCSPGQI